MADQNNDFVVKLLKEQYKQLTATKKELENSLQYYQGLVEDFKKRITQAASDIANIEASGIDLSEPEEETNTGGPTTETEVSPNLDGSSGSETTGSTESTKNTDASQATDSIETTNSQTTE